MKGPVGMRYRPDVDGLRALAILFVLFFHGGLTLFPSGFIGVDIFFVISGFLITSLIHESIQNNHFSFIEFYNRRLWRLQPVFVCLLVVATVFAFILYLPDDLVRYAKSARKSSLFLSNKYFAYVTSGYFAADGMRLPLLHTWSLAIEWQCYLILPIFIYLLQRLFAKQKLSKIIYGLTLFFFGLTLYFSLNYPVKAYYQFSSRIFEFLIGSSVALSPRHFAGNKRWLNIVNALAILTLVYIATRSNIKLGFPNWYALILCIATAVFIATGEYEPKPLLTKWFSTKPIVFIGLISYSLYIWHWPLFALVRYEEIKETTWVLLLTFTASFILAYLSWRFIEKPARRLNNLKFVYTVIFLLLLPVAAIHLSAYVIKNNAGLPQRFNREVVAVYERLKHSHIAQRDLCMDKNSIEINSQCRLGAVNSNSKKALMIGDSFSNHSWGFIDTLAKEANITVFAQATPGCLTLPGIFLYDWSTYGYRIYQECYLQTTRYFNMIQANHYDYVFIGESWSWLFR